MKTATVLVRSLVYGAVVTVAVAVIGAIVGYLVDGGAGLGSALIGAGLAAFFMGFTALSVIFAARVTRGRPPSMLYFGIILGAWGLKLVVFLIVMVVVRGQAWVHPYVFFGAVAAAVIGSLVADMVALKGARVPYVGDIELPGSPSSPATAKNSDF